MFFPHGGAGARQGPGPELQSTVVAPRVAESARQMALQGPVGCPATTLAAPLLDAV